MYDFNYHRASDLDEAVAKLNGCEDPKLLAGGMTLLPTLKNRLAQPSDLIDLAGIDLLKGISVYDDEVLVRAMTPHATVAASPEIQRAIPALAQLAGNIGDPAVRHRGTIGGSVANADPAADYPAGCVGLDAMIVTTKREIFADDFFTGLFETALEPDEIIVSVGFKIPNRAQYLKYRHPSSGYAIVGVMVAQYGSEVRVAVTGAGPSVFRVAEMEAALEQDFAPASLEGIAVDPGRLLGDMHCSADYRAHLVTVYARRAVEALVGVGRHG